MSWPISLEAQVPCPADARVPADWVTNAYEADSIELRMPASLHLVPPGKYFFVHGGRVWEDDRTKASVMSGHWSESSFDQVKGTRCRARIGDANVFFIVTPKSVVAWYDRGSASYEPVVSVSVENGELGQLAAIALSVKQKAAR